MKTLIQLALQVSRSTTESEFRTTLEETVGFMRGTTYAAVAHDTNQAAPLSARARAMTPCIHNLPSGYLQTFNSPSAGRVDPVMQHCRLSSEPIYWDRTTYASPDMTPQWEEMEAYGLRQGVSTALHPEPHRHFVLGVEWDIARPFDQEESKDMMLALQTVSIFAEPAAFRIWHADSHALEEEGHLPLSERERECLYWISRGMTDELAARIMEISKRTVRKHIDSCIVKLSASNRTEAAVMATKLGLLRRCTWTS